MMKHMIVWVSALCGAAVAAGAEPELVRVPGTAKVEVSTPAPRAQVIDLFGHQGGAEDRPALPESERELRRPEPQAAAGGAATPESRVIDRRARSSTGWGWTDAVPLAAVLGLIALAALAVRRFMPARGLIGQAPGLLDVVARTPVSPKQSIVLVRLGRRFLLLGVSPDRMSTLCAIDDAESAAELMGEVASRRADSSTTAFQSAFHVEEAEFADDEQRETAGSAGGHVRGLLEKVRRMKRSRVA